MVTRQQLYRFIECGLYNKINEHAKQLNEHICRDSKQMVCALWMPQRGLRCSGKCHQLGSSHPGFNSWVLHNLLEFVAWCPPSCYGSCGSLRVMPGPDRFRWVHLINIMLGARRTPNRVFFHCGCLKICSQLESVLVNVSLLL
jgi:hypothetical protein